MPTTPQRTDGDLLIRPAHAGDLVRMGEITTEAYFLVNDRMFPRSWPPPQPRPPAHQGFWITRTQAALETDPEGCWVAELDGDLVGCAISRTRELMWLLSSFAVLPGHQGRGIGTQLLAAALHYGRGCLRGMFAASADPAAFRRYRRAGFTMHPQMLLRGSVDRAAIPVIEHMREGNPADRDLMDSVDRSTRGAAHGPDHDLLIDQFRLVVTDRTNGSGYAYSDGNGSPVLVAATNRRTASDLLWECLAGSQPDTEVVVSHVTAANAWAIDVGLDARLEVFQSGYLALRSMKPPTPYVHHGSLL